MKLHFLKTKWSDMIILEHGGHYALVDTGFDEQYEQLSLYLDRLGVKQIEFILLTHFHRDHYGCITELVKNYKVKKVYLKEYSGLDSTTAWGTPADDEYRESEKRKFVDVKKAVVENSEYAPVEGLKEIWFDDVRLELFRAENSIKEIFEDESSPETYHKIIYSENQNSLAVLIKTDGKNILLGGDMMDYPSAHKKADNVFTQVSKEVGCKIDIYKAPHHGTVHTAGSEALSILKPAVAVITNEDEYLSASSDVYMNLKAADPDVKILLTETADVVIDTAD